MTEKRFARTRLADVMTFPAYAQLDAAIQAGQSFPDNARVKTIDWFSGKKTNLLTAVCVYWLKHLGYFASRNNTTGMPIKQRDGTVKWKPATGMRGSGDIYAMVIGGRSLWIEIKYGRDRMRPDQEKFRASVEAQGGLYWIVKTFDDLLTELKILNNQ